VWVLDGDQYTRRGEQVGINRARSGSLVSEDQGDAPEAQGAALV